MVAAACKAVTTDDQVRALAGKAHTFLLELTTRGLPIDQAIVLTKEFIVACIQTDLVDKRLDKQEKPPWE